MDWIKITTQLPPENVIVLTKIHDEYGERNEQRLIRRSNLYWEPDGKLYVYYTPTHFMKRIHDLENVDGACVNNDPFYNGYKEPVIKDRLMHMIDDMIKHGY